MSSSVASEEGEEEFSSSFHPSQEEMGSPAAAAAAARPSMSPPHTPRTTTTTTTTTRRALEQDDMLPPTPESSGYYAAADDDDDAASRPFSPTNAAQPTTTTTTTTTTIEPIVPPTPVAAHKDDDDDDDESMQSQLTPISLLRGNDNDDTNNEPTTPPPQQQQPQSTWEQDDDNDNDDHDFTGQAAHIRGTDIHVPTAAATFTDFLRHFVSLSHARRRQDRQDKDDASSMDSLMEDDDDDEEEEEEAPTPLYLSKLDQMIQRGTMTGTASLDIDTQHLYFHSQACQRLYHQLVAYPLEVVPLMDLVVQRQVQARIERLAHDENRDYTALLRLQVRPFNLKDTCNLRELDPIAMDSLVSIKGMIVRTSPVIPDLKVAYFGCVICGHGQQVTIDRGRIAEPTGPCPVCQTRNSHALVHNRSVFADKQLVRLQETPDKVPAGQTPASVLTFCFDDLVDAVQPGDKVEVTGVLRAQPVRVHPRMSTLKAVYKTYIDVIHYRTVNGLGSKAASSSGRSKTQFSPARVQQLQALSQQPDIYHRLTASLAPSIWELDDVKKGVLCMLLGGNHGDGPNQERTDNDDGDDNWLDQDDDDSNQNGKKRNKKRADVNILLCGDPGTSKSQLLSYVHKLSTRGVYTSGKGSSAVGLTASVVRDPETRDLVLESGALVLSDLGICCIDEFDKMSDTTRSVLHEAMEQQTVSIAKAGIIATLHSRTSILASANPSESRYNPNLSVVDNIQLPPTLLSRFDLIYLILDRPNVELDRRLAQHLVGLYYETPNVVEPPLDQELLKDYIQYARENIHPQISDEASDQLIASYLEMRNPGGSSGTSGTRTISATPRQLESLMRLSEALAKMRYSTVVTRADAREAVRLMKVATQTAATDPRTGRIDMDMITTGKGAAAREREEQLETALKELLAARRGTRLTFRDITATLREISGTDETISHDDLVDALRIMDADGVVQLNERAQTVFVRTGLSST